MVTCFDFIEKADAYFDCSWTKILAVSIGDEKVLPIPLLFLFRKSIGDTDNDTTVTDTVSLLPAILILTSLYST